MLETLKKTLLQRDYNIVSEELDLEILLGEDTDLDDVIDIDYLSEAKSEADFDDIPEDDPNLGDDDLDALLDEEGCKSKEKCNEETEMNKNMNKSDLEINDFFIESSEENEEENEEMDFEVEETLEESSEFNCFDFFNILFESEETKVEENEEFDEPQAAETEDLTQDDVEETLEESYFFDFMEL